MPAQRELVRAIEAGEQPSPIPAAFAKLRSTHNNYLTLPLLFIMISNHYPMTYGHEHAWLVLALIGGTAAFVRHYFNLKHQDNHQPWILAVGAVMLFGIIGWMVPKPVEVQAGQTVISDEKAVEISMARCASCHGAEPTQAGFAAAPGGVILETTEQLLANKQRILQAVQSNYMPLGNMTQMTDDERQDMVLWAAQ